MVRLRICGAVLERALRNIHADLAEALSTQHFAKIGRTRLKRIASYAAMSREPHLSMIALNRDADFNGSELRWIDL